MKKLVILLGIMALGTSCMNEKKLAEALKKNPKLITDAIKENPAEIMMALQEAAQNAKEAMAKKKEEEEKKKFEESFSNPLQPALSDSDIIRGTKGAPIVLVEYSDFECPFCTRGYKNVNTLLEKYKGKIKFIYKHLPLSFHPNAMPASKYFEALARQSHELAWKFHDEIFENQRQLKKGEVFLKKLAKKLGANMGKLAKDVKDPKIAEKIKKDMDEAAKFGIQGTPGFVLNGVPVRGAYPVDHFEMIISKLKEKGKLSL